jgi:tetratricopeptide (TPR) repeat protein
MKKARILFVIAFVLLSSSLGYSQGKYGKDSVACITNLQFYQDAYKAGNNEEAATYWRQALKLCPPTASENMFKLGANIMSTLIEKTTDPKLRASRIDTLLSLYDIRMANFPRSIVFATTYKFYKIAAYLGDQDQKVMDAFNETMKVCGDNTAGDVLVTGMSKIYEMYTKKTATADDVLKMYSTITPIIENQIKNSQEQEGPAKAIDAKQKIDYIFANSGVASCENIIALFGPKFKETPTDKELVGRIVKLLSDAQCYSADLYIQAVEELYKIDPSYKSASALSKLYAIRSDFPTAIKYLQEAIASPESSEVEDGSFLMEVSTYYAKLDQYGKAAEAAREAMQKNPAIAGQAYMMIGSAWGMAKCGGNEIESRAHFWVAVDYFIKAKNADPTLAQDADKYIRQFSQYFPLQEEAFMYDITDGSSYSVSCSGMSATTTVRTRK